MAREWLERLDANGVPLGFRAHTAAVIASGLVKRSDLSPSDLADCALAVADKIIARVTDDGDKMADAAIASANARDDAELRRELRRKP